MQSAFLFDFVVDAFKNNMCFGSKLIFITHVALAKQEVCFGTILSSHSKYLFSFSF
jgi:hypothetical protein